MQSVSPAFTAACQSAAQQPVSYLEISWDGLGQPGDGRGGAHWWDETAQLVEHSGTLRLEPPGEKLVAAGDVGRMTLILDDTAGRYRAADPASPLAPYIGAGRGLGGKPVRLWQGFDLPGGPEYVCWFTGVLETPEPDAGNRQVRLTCLDWGARYVNDKRSAALAAELRADEWIAQLAAGAGLTTRLDVGVFAIPWVWQDDEALVSEAWDAAGADGGLAYFDNRGALRYENPLHWPGHATVWTLGAGDFQRAQPRYDPARVASKVIVEWSARRLAPETVVYRLDEPKRLMPGQTLTWTARFDYPVARLFQPTVTAPYADFWARSAAGVDMTGSCQVVLSETCAQQCRIAVTNLTAAGAGTGLYLDKLELRGQPLNGGPTEQEEARPAANPLPYERVRSERGNAYLQTRAQGAALAAVLALRAGRARPTYEVTGILGLPQLELTDRVTLYAENIFGPVGLDALGDPVGGYGEGIVTQIRWRGGQAVGFTQDVTLLDMTDMLAHDDYFIIGAHALGAARRVYY